ncbi:MAG: sensor histidine kinase [Gammaproteobacteria bacterium]|nr:sensor histidine kinase [Gammaproteobacteria bacterium]MBU1490409.1 sensor histidine kinase [Gammaproteobacteria bacterium]MBU2140348.1 sensor histidine kinase [Gammaproteobacteria bacterium]MBU2217097.1 sensor histidine kinase [Gammaproteobacteria bacterium]MBU2321867.1 sensor histidine kinase [Gammaproteobacteria bacterium]
MPGRHSLFWKLAALLVTFVLLLISLSWFFSQRIELHTARLSPEARTQLQAYAAEAEQAWREDGAAGAQRYLRQLAHVEGRDAMLLDRDLQSLSGVPLTDIQRQRVTFMRQLDWPMSRRASKLPYIDIPFPGQAGHLVIQLPERFRPWAYREPLLLIARALLPACLALLFCIGLYRVLIAPLVRLRDQANALRADDLTPRAGPLALRRDELGDLARAFDHMAERLHGTVALQRQLLRNLSHELRTPLSRLGIASESELGAAALAQRVQHEVQIMQRLVGDTLQLAWLDTERPKLRPQALQLAVLWDVLCEDACFESGWSAERLHYQVPEACWVSCELNALAQALENVLRNAIRHSPPDGQVWLSGVREGDTWHLCLEDQGPGVASHELEAIFQPFTRLAGGPGEEGFGLGLSIARSAIIGQGGRIEARAGREGLAVHFYLPAAPRPRDSLKPMALMEPARLPLS